MKTDLFLSFPSENDTFGNNQEFPAQTKLKNVKEKLLTRI